MRFDSTPEEPQIMRDDALANRRLLGGILVSLIAHALVLSLQFGIPGLDFPSLEAPWKERRTPVQTLQVEIASPALKAAPVPPTPAVTTPELFKLPTPILPAPIPKMSAPPAGLQVLAMQSKPEPIPVAKKSVKPIKSSKPTPSLPVEKRVPPPSESPTRIIAQDRIKNADFVVPLTSEEELERHAQDKKETKQKLDAIPEDAIIDKNAEVDLIAEQKQQEELKQKKLAQEKLLAEQKQQAAERQQQIAQANEEKIKQQAEQQAAELKRQQAEQLAQQKMLAQHKAAVEQKQREQALEEAMREAKRQELLTQETLKQEEQTRQAEQKRLRQLALEQEQQKQEAQAQAQMRQKMAEEQAEKKRALEIAERQRQEELEAKKQETQRQLQIAEQKAAEQKQLEQKLLEQKIAEQKIAQQKLAEQKLAEQKVLEQKLAEQKALADAARANAEREAAIAASRQVAASNRSDVFGNGKGGTGSSANANNSGALTQSLGKGDLASRLREQARNTDLLKSPPSNSQFADEKSARRRSFLGAYDKEIPLRMYVDSLKHKLERNGNLIYERRTLSDVEHNVQINMVVRSDGSIEDVTIMRSSGSRAIDEKARNIIMANSPYSAFPPALALKYDVIEVQRVWSFGDKLRILENLPSTF
ncbi:MAG: energy transducer TonB [Candidatus Aquirickettsiella gammari]